MSSENTPQKINLILCDLPPGVTQSDLESFLSPYKKSIESIQINEKNPQKANATFTDLEMANKCRKEMNQRKIKNKNIRIMREEKYFLQKNKETKNNLYVKNIPKEKDARELYEYFLQFGDDENYTNIFYNSVMYFPSKSMKMKKWISLKQLF